MFKNSLPLVLAALVALTAASTLAQQPTPLLTKRSVNELVSVLKRDASEKEKADACRELGIIGTKECVPVLAPMLADEKFNHMARTALETIPDPSVDEAFRTALGTLKGRPLLGVIVSVGVRRDAQAVPALGKLLKAPEAEAARAAARALGSIGNSAATALLQGALSSTPEGSQLAVCEGLFRCAERFAAAGQRTEAIAIYDQLRALPGPHQVRAGGLRGAIVTRGKEGVPMLVRALRSDDWILVAAAARAAMELPAADVAGPLAAELGTMPTDNQVLAIQTLGKLGQAAALPGLATAAKSGAKPVRLAAVRAMPEIGGASAVPVLEGLMGDSDREIAQAAQESFAALAGPEADAAVVAMLKSSDAARQVAGLDLLSRRRMTKQMPEVLALAGNPAAAANVRSAALKRLGELGTPADLPALLGLLMQSKGSQELDAAEQAVSAVCAKATEPEASVGRVTGLLPQAAPPQKIALLRILSTLGGSTALGAVRSAVGDANPDVHKGAIRALGEWKTADAAPDLLALARKASNPTEKMLCLRSYLSLADNPDLPNGQRISMCREATSVVETAEEKKLLLAALGSISAANAVPLIVPYLDDPAIRAEAATAVLGITDKVLRAPGSSKVAPKLIEPLEKVAQATAGTELGKRATAAVEQAKKRAASGR